MELFDEEQRRAFVADGWWTGRTWSGLLDQAARTRPDATALVDPPNRAAVMSGEPRSLTWAEASEEVRRIGAALHALGVRRGDVVGVQLPNVVELPLTLLAVARLGAIACPFPIQYRSHELVRMSELAGLGVFVTTTAALGRDLAGEAADFSTAVPGLRAVAAFGDPASDPRLVPLEADEPAIAAADAYAAGLDLGSADPATIVWTSGTEGFPKGVPRAYGDWEVLGTACVQSPRLTSDDVLLNPFPMVNGGGLAGMFVPWLLTGCTLVQHHPFDLDLFCEQIEAHEVTYTCAPPPVLNAVVSGDGPDRDLSSLRAVSSGSAPLAGWMIDAWESGRGVEVLNLFGSNEGGMLFAEPETVPDPAQRGRLFPRYGRPGLAYRTRVASAMSARLVDLADGTEIDEPGRPGELRLKGPAIFSGYLGRGREGFDEDGWFCTGDVFEISHENEDLLVHVDRAKDLIIRGGYKISAAEIEAIVTADPRVAEAAAVALPDPDLGERLCLFVVPSGDEPVRLDDVLQIVRAADVAKFKWPERLEIVEALPRNPVGKVLKRELRDQLRTTTGVN
ncbi:class I adenylate-forming enzyme family protein [Aeromicrobium choanae]|uniref:Acyl-CoA synthetase (AMP-forming)/AMP-acid ligase II n=1 Tax=Aeromicrobium choanae TaxID=1736691 RepID=A0A1T4YUQ3_9ACTN|nr:class I adenylate-forming enzyme family protein [Aeromicrobium choanae]SKB05318.1 Acyl-CoA synthetase (AMP-forming)/AMP-acid ligase II [Aeromicrobium choanae]